MTSFANEILSKIYFSQAQERKIIGLLSPIIWTSHNDKVPNPTQAIRGQLGSTKKWLFEVHDIYQINPVCCNRLFMA